MQKDRAECEAAGDEAHHISAEATFMVMLVVLAIAHLKGSVCRRDRQVSIWERDDRLDNLLQTSRLARTWIELHRQTTRERIGYDVRDANGSLEGRRQCRRPSRRAFQSVDLPADPARNFRADGNELSSIRFRRAHVPGCELQR